MYTVKVITSFSAAHSLRNYKGKCENVHGHNWRVEALVSSESLDSLGMVVDFSKLKKQLVDVIRKLDHSYLNDSGYFSRHNPSSEEIAGFIFQKLKGKVGKQGASLKEIRVWETDSSCAVYNE